MSDRDYTVTGINGYRKANLTLAEAKALRKEIIEEMPVTGWHGEVRIFYRDGSEVKETP